MRMRAAACLDLGIVRSGCPSRGHRSAAGGERTSASHSRIPSVPGSNRTAAGGTRKTRVHRAGILRHPRRHRDTWDENNIPVVQTADAPYAGYKAPFTDDVLRELHPEHGKRETGHRGHQSARKAAPVAANRCRRDQLGCRSGRHPVRECRFQTEWVTASCRRTNVQLWSQLFE